MLRRLFKKTSPANNDPNMNPNMDPEVVDDLKQAQRVAEAVFEYTQPVLITDARARI